MDRPTAETALLDVVAALHDDEFAVLLEVATQLRRAQDGPEYGPLFLLHDGRDFVAEAGKECIDALAYLAMHAVRRRHGG
jgi:hypothetical protein